MSHAYKFRPHVGTLNIRPPSAARPFLGILPSRLRIKDKRRFGTAFSALFGKSRMEINTNNSLSSAYSRRPSIPPSFPAFHHLGVLSVRFCITNSGTVGSPLSALMHSQSRVHISHNRHLAYRLRTPPPLTIRLFLCVWSFRLCITYSGTYRHCSAILPSQSPIDINPNLSPVSDDSQHRSIRPLCPTHRLLGSHPLGCSSPIHTP